MKKVILVEELITFQQHIKSDYYYIDYIKDSLVIIYPSDDINCYVLSLGNFQIKQLIDLNYIIDFIKNTECKFYIKNLNDLLFNITDLVTMSRVMDVNVYLYYINNLIGKEESDITKLNYKNKKQYNFNYSLYKNTINPRIVNILNIVESSFEFHKNIFMKYFDINFNINRVISFNFLNKMVENGICDNGEIVFIEYKIHSVTRRPMIIDKFEYMNLNKNNGSRERIKSRFGEDGSIVEIDFQSCHLQFLDRLLNLFPNKQRGFNYHNEMSRILFKRDLEKPADKKELKSKLFNVLYSEHQEKIDNPVLHKIYLLSEQLQEEYNKNGFIFGVDKTKIYFDQIPNKNKILNYFIQDLETSINMNIINTLYISQKYGNNNKWNLILYIYDSFVFDVEKRDLRFFKEIMDIILDSFIYSYSVGESFNFNNIIKEDNG